MPSPREAYLRYATHYLNVARSTLNKWTGSDSDWNELEENLNQLRNAWKWLSQNAGESFAADLTFAYGELAWQLLETTRERLSKLVVSLKVSELNATATDFQAQTIEKLNEIIATQLRIQSLLPDISVLGSRNVAAANIINSTIYTGNISIHGTEVGEHQVPTLEPKILKLE
jgi:hypothetical protein